MTGSGSSAWARSFARAFRAPDDGRSLWIVAAIGMAAGAATTVGLVVTAVTVFALGLLVPASRWSTRPARRGRLLVELKPGTSVEPVLAEIEEVRGLEVEDETDRRLVTIEVHRGMNEGLVSRVADLADVVAVRWRS